MYTKKREMFKKEFEKLSTKEINSKIADLERENTKIKEDVEKYLTLKKWIQMEIIKHINND